MRQVGSLSNQSDANRFAAYLVTEGVSAHSEGDGKKWIVWVHDENQVARAKEQFASFQNDPAGQAYDGVERQAEEILLEETRQRERASKNVIEMRGRWRSGQGRKRPLVITLIAISIGVFLASGQGYSREGPVARSLLFADIVKLKRTGDPLVDIRQGQVWRMVTPIFYHYGVMHIVFNMIMIYQLGGLVEDRRGTWTLGWMVLFVAVVSNTVQCLLPLGMGGAPLAAGMSGVLYGVFGYAWMKTKFEPELGILLPQSLITVLLGWMLLCMTGLMERFGMSVANWAHGVGFAAGVVIGYAPVLLKLARRE